MKPTSLLRRAAPAGALAAILFSLAVPLAAQPAPVQRGPVYSGLDCARCTLGATYCVINPFRFEYACAPTGTYACVGAARTGWCPYGTTCWDGVCR